MDDQNTHSKANWQKNQLLLIDSLILILVVIAYGCAPKGGGPEEIWTWKVKAHTSVPPTATKLVEGETIVDVVETPNQSAMETITPTSPVEEVMTETEMDEILQECFTNLEEGKNQLIEHYEMEGGDCEAGIRNLEAAIESATEVLEIEPDNAEACLCRGLSRLYLEEKLNEAKADLECAVAGLEGEDKDEAENALAKVDEILSMPVCAELGKPEFAEEWAGDELVNPDTTFPANETKEVSAKWSISNSCNEQVMVKWYHDGKHKCQHHINFQEDWTWGTSSWYADEEWIELGKWCMKVYVGPTLMTEGCFTIE